MVSSRSKSKDFSLQLVAQDAPSKANQYTPIPQVGETEVEPEAENDDLGSTISLASADVRRVLVAQDDQGRILTTKLNILFVSNGALLTNLSLARLMI